MIRKMNLMNVTNNSNMEILQLLNLQERQIFNAIGNERRRISEELHDGVLGKLFAVLIYFKSFKDIFSNLDDGKRDLYKDAINTLIEANNDIRSISHELNSRVFESESGFESALKGFVKHITESSGIKVNISLSDFNLDELSNEMKISIYRIIQEGVNNAIKYSGASEIMLVISIDESNINLNIKDNGIGFKTQDTYKGIGLKNIKSRVAKFNGFFEINSKIGAGTFINVSLPINNI